MKHILFLFAIILFSLSVTAQTDTSTVERYCMVAATAKFMSTKVTIAIDFGEQINIWKDNRVKDEMTGKAKSFNSVIDALNYMGEQGWKLVNAYLIGNGPYVYHYVFRKSFPKELN
jgi:hypothetical protein